MILVASVGCGGRGGKDDSGDGLTFWTAEDAIRVKATQAIVDRFQQQTNIKVKLVAVSEDQLIQVGSASAAEDSARCARRRVARGRAFLGR